MPDTILPTAASRRPAGAAERGWSPVGLFEDATYETGTEVSPPQGRLLIYTDGVIEARDGHDEEFGLQRLTDLCAAATGPLDKPLGQHPGGGGELEWRVEPADDLTLVAVASKGDKPYRIGGPMDRPRCCSRSA